MTERLTRDEQIAQADDIMREIAWHAQKQATQILTRSDIDLTLPQMVTLFAIYENGSCRMSALAEATQQSAGTLTGIVDRLIDDGLVMRTRNDSDRRVVEVVLTAKGEQRIQRVIGARRTDMRRLFGRFGDEELTRLVGMLRILLEEMQSKGSAAEAL